MHTYEKMKTCSPQSDNAAEDINTFTWLTYSTHCWPAVPFVSRFTRYPNGLWETKAPYVTEDLALACFSFVKWSYCWWKRETDIITIPWHIGQMTVPTAWGDCAWNIFVFDNYCANEAYHRDTSKITGQHKNGFMWPFTLTLWNVLDTFVYLDSCILMTTKKTLIRWMIIMTDCGKWELYWNSSVISMLNVTAQLHI
jgi:hypothetical protein